MPTASLLASLDYQGAVNAAVLSAGATYSPRAVLSGAELAAMDAARNAGIAPEAFAAEVIASRAIDAALEHEPIRPSHAQANRWAENANQSCDCGHPRWMHNDDGRCRAQRGRCSCRSIEMRRAS